jgi:hypothetical protein
VSGRICYSRPAFLRRTQMSRIGLFVIVEGRNLDPVFYDRICRASPRIMSSGHQIWLVEQTSGGAGGKEASLSLFDHCRRLGKLRRVRPDGTSSSLVFVVDRDCDHIAGGTRRSPHVVYTKHFDVEAEVYSYGKDDEAFAEALSLDLATARGLVRSLGNWRTDLAHNQREWIQLCAISRSLSAHVGGVGFKVPSRVNAPPPFGAVDARAVAAARRRVLAKSQYSPAVTTRRVSRVELSVARLFGSGDEWLLVKGKWATTYLADKVRAHFGRDPVDTSALPHGLAKAFLSTIDYGDPRLRHYYDPFEALI